MNGLLLLLLSVALGQSANTELKWTEVAFAELPPECAAEYHAELREFRKASTTRVCRRDLDGDGEEELLVWTGESGSGGEVWSVMTKRNGKYRHAGRVFGLVHFVDRPPYRGLVVGTPCGWEQATWEYWELKDETLYCRLKLDIRYRKSEGHVLRTRPVEIRIKELP